MSPNHKFSIFSTAVALKIRSRSPKSNKLFVLFVCVEVLRPSQPNGVMSSAVVYLTTHLLGRLSPLSG